jgi:hypothetical protein
MEMGNEEDFDVEVLDDIIPYSYHYTPKRL